MAIENYWCRRPFGYNGQEYDRGQIIRMANARNDEKLIRLGYVQKLGAKFGAHECGKCGAKFIELNMLNAHGDKRHEAEVIEVVGAGPVDPETGEQTMIDVTGDSEEKVLNEVAPLFLDKTKASAAA